MDILLFALIAAGHLGLLCLGVVSAVRYGFWTPASIPLLVLVGLVYDNAVLAAGSAIGEGALLETLSGARYWIHAFVTPLLVVFAWHAAVRASRTAETARWLRHPGAAVAAVVVAVVLVGVELSHVVGLDLEVRREYDVLAYADDGSGGPPVMVLVVALALVVAGVAVGRWQGWWWLLAGAVAMTVGGGLPLPVPSAAATNVFELLLLASLVATRRHQDGRDRVTTGT